jgi:hypothetical protein
MSVFHFQGKILHVLILEERTISVHAGATAIIQVTVIRDFIFRCMEHRNIIIRQAVTASYYFSEDTTWYMWNVVYETYEDCDYKAAYLIASPQGSIYDDFECWWSPDNGSGITWDEER